MIDTYYGLESAIIARLKECVPEIQDIYTPFSIDDITQMVTVSPSISVIYMEERVGESVGQGKANVVYQQWLVVLAVSDASAQLQTTSAIRAKAAPLAVSILRALQGFNPNLKGFRELKRVTAPVSGGYSAGYAYFPFMFEAQLIVV